MDVRCIKCLRLCEDGKRIDQVPVGGLTESGVSLSPLPPPPPPALLDEMVAEAELPSPSLKSPRMDEASIYSSSSGAYLCKWMSLAQPVHKRQK